MTKDFIIALLGIGLVFAVAGLLVALAKLQEEKERRWDEISRAESIEKKLEQSEEREKCSVEAILWYADELTQMRGYFEQFRSEHTALQDKLPAAVCPRNDHIWVNGFCKKCGRPEK